ncbi:MAG: GEVED domain-containing protein [Arcticibacter sp.]
MTGTITQNIRSFIAVAFLGVSLLMTSGAKAQVVYNEGFEITNGATVTYPLLSMPMGWSTSKYCTTVGSYTTGTCNSTSPGFSRYGAASSFPTCSPRTGNTMLGFNSYYIINGEKAFVASKKLDINTIGANSMTGSLWMYRDSGLYNATFDSISIHVNNSPTITTSAKRVTLNGSYLSMPRSYSQTPACPANSWYQINFTIPNADVATWTTQGIYIIIMGHSADGNQIYLDDFSVQEYPLAAPIVVANQTGLTLQNTATTQPNQLNQLIVGAKIQTTGSNATTGTKVTINNFTFNTNGSSNPPSDISSAKLWWTGGTNAFDPSLAVLLGTVVNPWATNYTFLTTAWGGGVDPNLWLQYGDNYFWITYDIAPSASSGNFVDAEWVSGQYNGATLLSITPQSLTGARLIDLTYCIPAYAVGTSWAGYQNNDYVQCVQLDDLNGTGGINNGPLGNTPLSAAGPNCPTPGNPCGFQSHPPDYEFFLPGVNKTAILTGGNTYQIKVACGTWYSSNYIAAWIDYNKTGTFTNTLNIGATATLMGAGGGEKICQSPNMVNSGGSCNGPLGSNFIQQFTIPQDAIPGNTRLRVREVYATSQIDPCAYATYGETEDYVVTLIPPCAPAWIGWKTWLGFTDDWNNPANWCGGVPTINDNARIPVYGSGPNDRPGYKMPRLKSGITAVAKNLRIEAPATASDTSAFMIDAAAMGANGVATASLTVSEDMSALAGSRIKVISDLRDTAQLSNGTLRTPTVPSTNEPFSNVLKKRIFYVYTQSDMLFDGIVANDIIDTILIHMKRNGASTEPMRNFTIKYYYTDGTVPGFTFNGAPFTGVAATNYRNMPNIIGAAPTTIYGPTNLATSTFIPTSLSSGTVVLPLIPNSFKWNGTTNKLVIEMVWDNTSSGIVPLGATEGTTFTQTSTQGYRHNIGISETKVSSTYSAANFVVPFSALPQTSTAGAVTWTAGTNTMASTYANATFAVGQWVSGTGISVLKGATAVTGGNATITLATGTTGIQVGMYLSATGGWAPGVSPQVTAVAAGSVTVSIAPTTTGTYNLTFCPYITALSSATPPYTAITLNCVLPGSTTAGSLSFGSLHTTPTVGADYRSNLTFKVRRPYGKFPIEVRKDWVNQGEFVSGVSRVSMTTTTAGVVDSMYNVAPTSFYDLVINNGDGVKMYNADITIKDTLTLTAGRLKANNQLITLGLDTVPGVLVRTAGGIQLDQDVLGADVAPYGRFRWFMGSATGSLDIPLYNQANTYIPFTYNRVSGTHVPTIATYATPGTNLNMPAPVTSIAALNLSWTNGDGIADRYYFVSNAGTSPRADITYRYANSERASFTNTNMRMQRWTGSEWERTIANGGTFPLPGQIHTIASPADGVFLPSTSYSMTAAGDWWTFVGEPTPLPVSLLNFTATPFKDRVRLDWTTASEYNTSHFEIERTLNHNDFLNLGRVSSRGPSSNNLDYRLWDNNPIEGKQFYYLRQYDVDGSLSTYGPVSATFTRDVFDIVNTTVSASEMGVNVVFSYNSDEPVNYRIIDMAGRTVASQNRVAATPGLNVIDIDAKLSKGAYQIIIMNSEKSVARKFFY